MVTNKLQGKSAKGATLPEMELAEDHAAAWRSRVASRMSADDAAPRSGAWPPRPAHETLLRTTADDLDALVTAHGVQTTPVFAALVKALTGAEEADTPLLAAGSALAGIGEYETDHRQRVRLQQVVLARSARRTQSLKSKGLYTYHRRVRVGPRRSFGRPLRASSKTPSYQVPFSILPST